VEDPELITKQQKVGGRIAEIITRERAKRVSKK
jgi:hypothetical protein